EVDEWGTDTGIWHDRRLRVDLVDDVEPETARGQEGVDLALPLAGFERFPAPQLARDRASRSVALALSGQVPKCRIDGLACHAFTRELALERAITLRPEPRALLDPVLGEIEIIDVALRAELVDRAVDGFVVVTLAAQVTTDLAHAARPAREELDGSLVRAAERLRLGASFPHRSDCSSRFPRRGYARAPSCRSRRRRPRDRAGTAWRSRDPARCGSCRS